MVELITRTATDLPTDVRVDLELPIHDASDELETAL